MLYESIIKLNNLKKVKWYNFINKYRNYKLLYNVLNELKDLVQLNFVREDIYVKIVDFLSGAYAIKGIKDPAIFGVAIYRESNSLTNYDVSDKCFHVSFLDTSLNELKLYINMNTETIEVMYGMDEYDYKDVFIISKGHKIDRLTSMRKLAIGEIQLAMEKYIKGMINMLYDDYT